MGTSLRPERPSIEELIGDKPDRPSLESLLGSDRAPTPVQAALRREQEKGLLAPRLRRINENEAEAAESPSYAGQALGGIASLVRDIPGAEAAQAGIRAAVRGPQFMGLPMVAGFGGRYREALTDIRGAEDTAHPAVRIGNRIAGGGVAAALMPGGPALQGARYGVLSGALSADPSKYSGDRLLRTVVGGAAGAAGGKVADVAIKGGRAAVSAIKAARSPTRGALALADREARKAATRPLYAKAELEGAANSTAYAPGERTMAVRDEAGRLRRNLSQVSDEELQRESLRLAELNSAEEGLHEGIQKSGYREDYNALPRTERLGAKGREDLPDADGEMDPDILAGHNQIIRDFNKSAIVRRARAAAMERIDSEIAKRPSATAFDFGSNTKVSAGEQGARDALKDPAISSTVARVTGQPKYADADVATVLRGTYKRLGKESRGLEKSVKREYDPTKADRLEDVNAAKGRLQDAADPIMPSWREANKTFAEHTQASDVGRQFGRVANRLATKSSVPDSKLETETLEALRRDVLPNLTPRQRASAIAQVRARTKENIGLTKNPFTGFGVVPSLRNVGRVQPLLNDLTRRGTTTEDILRAAGISLATP